MWLREDGVLGGRKRGRGIMGGGGRQEDKADKWSKRDEWNSKNWYK